MNNNVFFFGGGCKQPQYIPILTMVDVGDETCMTGFIWDHSPWVPTWVIRWCFSIAVICSPYQSMNYFCQVMSRRCWWLSYIIYIKLQYIKIYQIISSYMSYIKLYQVMSNYIKLYQIMSSYIKLPLYIPLVIVSYLPLFPWYIHIYTHKYVNVLIIYIYIYIYVSHFLTKRNDYSRRNSSTESLLSQPEPDAARVPVTVACLTN